MSEPELDVLLDRLAVVNPFLDNRVNGPFPVADVVEIHEGAQQRLVELAEQSLDAQQGVGALLWGAAGVGKSHLLARLGRWADEGHARLIYVHNLQAAPHAIPRALLQSTIASLTAGRRDHFFGTPLFEMVRAALYEAAGKEGPHRWSSVEHAFKLWIDRQASQACDRQVYEVLFAFFHSAFECGRGRGDDSVARLAVRWLGGGALDPGEGRRLGLPPARSREDAIVLEDAHAIRQVFVALARLGRVERRPFLLALDQVDNLDDEQFSALTRFLEAILDASPGLMVVTTGIQATLTRWHEQRVVQSSAWDRIAQVTVLLHNLTPGRAEDLLHRRLDQFLAPFSKLADLARLRRLDPLFPLGRVWARRHLLHRAEIRPRDVISLAREGWQAQQDRLRRQGKASWVATWPGVDAVEVPRPAWNEEQQLAAIDQVVGNVVEATRKRLHAEPGQLPADADRLAALLFDLLDQYRQTPDSALTSVQRHPPPRAGAHPTYHLSLTRPGVDREEVTGVLVMATAAKQAVAGFLRRLCEDSRPLDRVVVVTDEQVGMPLGDRGKEHLEDLTSRGPERFLVFTLTFAERAVLEALGQAVNRARSQDLELEQPDGTRRVLSPAEVIASHQRQESYRGHRLLADLLFRPRGPEGGLQLAGRETSV